MFAVTRSPFRETATAIAPSAPWSFLCLISAHPGKVLNTPTSLESLPLDLWGSPVLAQTLPGVTPKSLLTDGGITLEPSLCPK